MEGKDIFAVLGTLALGAAGWFVSQFFVRQIARFYEVREQIIETMYFTENVGELALRDEPERFRLAVAELRRCAARLTAIEKGKTPLTHLYLSWRRYDLSKAIAGLTGLSNGLGTKREYPVDGLKRDIRAGLKLAHSS